MWSSHVVRRATCRVEWKTAFSCNTKVASRPSAPPTDQSRRLCWWKLHSSRAKNAPPVSWRSTRTGETSSRCSSVLFAKPVSTEAVSSSRRGLRASISAAAPCAATESFSSGRCSKWESKFRNSTFLQLWF